MIDRSRLRLVVLQVVVLSLMATLLGRLWVLQVVHAEQYQRSASANSGRKLVTPAPRGFIYDARGVPLAQNQVALVVSVSRGTLDRRKDDGAGLLRRVAEVIDEPFEELWGRTRMCRDKGAPPPPLCWNGTYQQPIPLTDDADPAMALQIMERKEEFEGVTAELTPIRAYPKKEGVNAAHLLGYVGPVTEEEAARSKEALAAGKAEVELSTTDYNGKSGLERQYDTWLRGRPGVRHLAVDNKGAVTGVVSEVAPDPGAHLVTSIDARVQAVAERQLDAAIRRAREEGDYNKQFAKRKADSGAVVVMDVKTGAVLALASWPTYDPQIWVGGIDPKDYAAVSGEQNNYPNINRATQGDFVAASTFKAITLPAAVEAGVADPKKSYGCPGSVTLDGRTYTNYESRDEGSLNLDMIIAKSCDTVFYRWAYDLWRADGGKQARPGAKNTMLETALGFGLGKRTGIDLPSERPGRVVTRESKQRLWEATKDKACRRAEAGYPELSKTNPGQAKFLKRFDHEYCLDGYIYRGGDAINFSIGQGDTSVTPLQITRAYAAIANGGDLVVPQIARGAVSNDGRVLEEFKPRSEGRLPVDAKTIKLMQDAFRLTTEKGTGAGPFLRRFNWPIEQIPIASKTGTGQVSNNRDGSPRDTTSWFASYAPADDPQIAVLMTVSQGGTGSGISGPSVRDIYRAIFGVQDDGSIDRSKAIYPDGKPVRALPRTGPGGLVTPQTPAPLAPPSGPAAGPAATAPPRRPSPPTSSPTTARATARATT